LRNEGYECVLGGKMHFIGDQLHGYEYRLTADIYPADLGWSVNWDEPDTRLEWYHNSSSILQAGPCVRSNQLDYDEEVMYKAKQFLYDHVRKPPGSRPFCLTVSMTHPHDPYTIEKKYWDMYEDVDIDMPKVQLPKDQLDSHSKRLQHVCDLEDYDFTPDQIKRAKRAYYGAVSYVDDNIGKLMQTLEECGLADNTIVIFSGDHGDMLGERGLWYKMSYFESSVRVPMLFSYPKLWSPHRVPQSVSTLDILPTLVDIVGAKLHPHLPMDGVSMEPHLRGLSKHDNVFAEYMGEGTIAPMMMIRRGPWNTLPARQTQTSSTIWSRTATSCTTWRPAPTPRPSGYTTLSLPRPRPSGTCPPSRPTSSNANACGDSASPPSRKACGPAGTTRSPTTAGISTSAATWTWTTWSVALATPSSTRTGKSSSRSLRCC